MTSNTPTKTRGRRAADLGAAMSAAIILTWLLKQSGVEVPGEITAAIATLIGFVGSFLSDFIPPRDKGGPPSGGKAAAVAMIAVLLVGCANLTAPQSAKQRLAYVDGQFSALVNTAADLRQQGIMTAEQAREIDPDIQRGSEALDQAWLLIEQDLPDEALDYVRIVNRLLPEIRAVVQEASNDGG